MQSPVILFFSAPNVSLRTLKMTNQVPHPYKITGKIVE
jgi:hypothetical protein